MSQLSTKDTPLTVIILAHQLSQSLRQAINSATWAKEIVIIDTSQNEVCKELSNQQIKIYPKPTTWQQLDYAKLRNEAIKLIKNEWFLFLDSDETLDETAQKSIQEFLSNSTSTKNFVGAKLKRSDFFLGQKLRFGEVANVQLLRLGKKGSIKYHRGVHEVAQPNGLTTNLSGEIYHYAHLSISEFIQSIARYSWLEQRERNYSWKTIAQLICFPGLKLIHNLIIRKGLFDGWRGLVYACIMSLHSLWTRIFLYEAHLSATNRQSQVNTTETNS